LVEEMIVRLRELLVKLDPLFWIVVRAKLSARLCFM